VSRRGLEETDQRGHHLLPEESPVVLISSHVSRSRSITLISLTSAVGSTVVLVVLVVDFENSKGLLAGDACVIGALSGLDGVGGLGSCATPVSLERVLVCQMSYESMLGSLGIGPWCCSWQAQE
jgi:hypothetical protein